MLSPILLFVYNRLTHTQRCVEALLKNPLASESELFIYSDEAKDDIQKETVNEVRKYIHTVNGFKNITIIERNENWGLAKSIIDGVSTQVNRYGKVIVLEDDLVVAPHFLQFMNDALEAYILDCPTCSYNVYFNGASDAWSSASPIPFGRGFFARGA